jgi:hypothetical protein
MTSRVAELAMRRQMLVLRSERLREELVAEQFAIRQSLGGVDRAISIARGFGSPMLLFGVGAMALSAMRKVRSVTWGVRALTLISLARRALTLVQMFRTVTQSRRH